jgi:hypothetical protein
MARPPAPRRARPAATLAELRRIQGTYGPGASAAKQRVLARLERAALPRARDVLALHETLCWLRAYPDDAALLARVERMLERFARRRDLRRHRRALRDSGIAGTEIRFRFFAPTAQRLAARWGGRLTMDWPAFKDPGRLEPLLSLFALHAETPGLDEYAYSTRQWIDRLKGPQETDAAFLVRRFAALRMDEPARATLYDQLDPPLRLAPGPDTPARTRARYGPAPVVFQTGPLQTARPRLAEAYRAPIVADRALVPREGRRLIDLACDAMVTRSRDLDVFAYGDPRDVRLLDCGAGLQFAVIGAVPERRLLLESVYGFLTLKNGVPIGYVLASALNRSSEIAYNVFETYRGGESSAIYGRVVACVSHLFGADAFTIFPYQLGGDGNDEGLRSGAFWFYQKLGFTPRAPEARRVLAGELARLKKDPRHRSDLATLRRLAAHNVFWQPGTRERGDVMGVLPLPNVGLHVTRFLAERFGSDRERGERTCSREAAALLGQRSLNAFTPGERQAWNRWAPLVVILPGVRSWTRPEKRALAQVVRAKGGRRESDFVRLFDAHRKLRAAVRRLAQTPVP